MEPKTIFKTVHEDFFGNIVGSIVKNVKQATTSTTPTAAVEFFVEWTIPAIGKQ